MMPIDLGARCRPRASSPASRPAIRNEPVTYGKRRFWRRSRTEKMFGHLEDWRRVATCYDRCPTVFYSAAAVAATVIF